MFKVYVSQVKTSKTTGDVQLALDILNSAKDENMKQEAMSIDHKEVVILTLKEFNTYLEIVEEAKTNYEGMKQETKTEAINLGLEEE